MGKTNLAVRLVAAVVFLLLGCLQAGRYINEFPAYVHAWAQADWYSIALGFINNGFDFLHPETLIYNKQFPGCWLVDYNSTVTSVDFPLHEYVVAFLMWIFDTKEPWVFHLWTWLCSMVGVWFLFLMARRITGSALKSIAVVMLCMTTPVYAFYMANFLPSAPSLSLIMVGLWAYIRHWQENCERDWHLSVSLLALATLTRTSQLVTLLAVCLFELLRIIRKEERLKLKWLSVAIAIAAIGGFYLWNRHLAAEHGTLFLGYLRPPENWENVEFVFDHIRYSWKWQYFTRLQHWIVAVSLIAALVYALWRRKQKQPTSAPLSLGWLAAIWFLGEICFFVAMMMQYVDHDYYFLDSFYLPIIFSFALALRSLPAIGNRRIAALIVVVLLILGGSMYNGAKHALRGRRGSEDCAMQTALNYDGSAQWLDKIGVSRDARMLAFVSYPQNSPFIKMERRGYSVMWWDNSIVERALTFNFDYIVMENTVYETSREEHSNVLKYFKPVATNGSITLYTIEPKSVIE